MLLVVIQIHYNEQIKKNPTGTTKLYFRLDRFTLIDGRHLMKKTEY